MELTEVDITAITVVAVLIRTLVAIAKPIAITVLAVTLVIAVVT